ncbi:hypothetical protein NGA_0392502 [Nannochloropsis gaditana CCMP526]|uniref:uncharacterized protein n=1 Tax=Nannochloropsis gaditana (strain CCMP526) TaxID=1093141 RepID=UPI00029F7E7C|nr:hypothetical protein NGA_0392502 [Nannochloropsis gaditana CCMP526]XP_005854908.1 hypothetical protein NGA_0392501 [Nannochloropsis gaditana CCMP526]EKU21452.1 hypothetical protein NGA_0392501 [Nannochloropsis gaditana CCMP526]EKU22364.1 hypothetical protein NGA_0392502 [Nannochloropsis gaditana CCMP526]|eukprot:XP_005853995.1 hypothetical protein NGA_0392502 [Nannochloropsis gaditana CCMP526]
MDRARVLPSDCQQLEPHDERVLERGRHAPVMSASFLGSAVLRLSTALPSILGGIGAAMVSRWC